MDKIGLSSLEHVLCDEDDKAHLIEAHRVIEEIWFPRHDNHLRVVTTQVEP